MPQRTCLGCRGVREQKELVRFAVVQGVLCMERGRRLEGRGAYLCASLDCVSAALKRKGAFSRALKEHVEVPDEETFQQWIKCG